VARHLINDLAKSPDVSKKQTHHILTKKNRESARADEAEDGQTGFLIERALDDARARQFRAN
jgi:hypothetical protein